MPHRLRKHYPAKPSHEALQNAYVIICNAHKAASSSPPAVPGCQEVQEGERDPH